MATKKETASTKTEEQPQSVDMTPTVVAVTCSLLQSPRFAHRITDEAQQDRCVAVAVAIARKIHAATA